MKLEAGNTYRTKVVSIKPFGAILEMEDGKTELLHISNITTEFVKDVNDYFKEGDIVDVDCIKGSVKDLELSTKRIVDREE